MQYQGLVFALPHYESHVKLRLRLSETRDESIQVLLLNRVNIETET
jgi:hypothetical protein